MKPTFYFAIGGRFSTLDLDVALTVGQRHFLVPVGTSGARLLLSYLQRDTTIRVILDSGAFPPNNPRRVTLTQYAHELLSWRDNDGIWSCNWAASYDHLGDPQRTENDHQRLLRLLAPHDHDPPIVPVLHYPDSSAHDIIGPLHAMVYDHLVTEEWAALATARRCGAVDGPADHPAFAVGSLVPQRYSVAATGWYERLIGELEAASELHPCERSLHLFGVGRPTWTLRSPLVRSFDSSGPAQLARFGWPKIAPSYTDAYGYTPAKLQRSRATRLAYWLAHYRTTIEQPSNVLDEALLPDDQPPAPRRWHQLSFVT